LPFFAEDLGHITPEVHALRDRLHRPGMAVLQFGFGDEGAHDVSADIAAPARSYLHRTHDNDTRPDGGIPAAPSTNAAMPWPMLAGLTTGSIGVHSAAQSSVAEKSIPLGKGPGQRGPHEYSQPARECEVALQMSDSQNVEKACHLAEVYDRLPCRFPSSRRNVCR